MKSTVEETSLRVYLGKRLLPGTIAIAFIISIFFPVTFYVDARGAAKQTAMLYAHEFSEKIYNVIVNSPTLWKYQAQKYLQAVYEFVPYKNVEDIHVFDDKGQRISAYDFQTLGNHKYGYFGICTATAPIVFNNRVVGRVMVVMSLKRVIKMTLLIFGVSLTVGTGLAYFAYAFPLRVVKGAEEKLGESEKKLQTLNQELEVKVEERTKELLDAQEELVRKEKLVTLGQLAGSVGHELRNPLGVMSNAVYYLKSVMPGADETVKEYLDMIKSEIDNSQRIISDLLDFSRTKMPQTRSVTVNELITQGIEKCLVPAGISLRVEIPDTLPGVKVDPFQVAQAFQNLIMNGIQAMPQGGTLHIAARRVKREGLGVRSKEEIASHLTPHASTDFIEISVTDTGEGVSPVNMKKLFQPLFTTKARGIGLGLVFSKNSVEASGGWIEVESQPGTGTTFTVILPAEGIKP